MLRFWILSAVLLTIASAERPGQWRILGPGGGGSIYHPTISPHDSRTILVACDMTGSYISHNAGESWRMFNLGMPARFFLFDPVDRNTIYAKTNVLWRSTDTGKTWRMVYPRPESVTSMIMPDDHASQRFITRQPCGNLRALAINPADSNFLYAAIEDAGPTRLHLSQDRGASWRVSDELPGGVERMYARKDGRLYAAGHSGVAVSESGTWIRGNTPEGVKEFRDISVGFLKNGQPVAYAISESDVFVSEDAGRNWRRCALPGKAGELQAIATSLNHPDVAYVSYSGMRIEGMPHLGVARTADRGRTWQPVWTRDNMSNDWITERFGPDWGGNPYMLAVGPEDPNICFGTDSGRTMRTLDGGKTWRGMYTARQSGGWTSTGLDVTTTYGVHFDPFDVGRLFITYTDIGLFQSDDGGKSWSSATKGVPRQWVNTTYWIEFDPAVKGRVWGVMSYVHDLPRPKMWRGRSPSTYVGGIAISEDGGRSWNPSVEGMNPTAATHVLLDPASPVDNRVLYVAGFGRGVFKSVDGGKRWALKNAGIDGSEPFAWRFARDRAGTLYLVVARRSEDGSIGNDQDGALYRSTDGAENWSKLRLPEGVNGPNGLAIDPQDPDRMYLAAWGRRTPEGAVGGGVFLTKDGGKTWSHVLVKDQHVYDVTIDPKDTRILYACGFESSAWRSTDRGETWRRIPGYNFKWGHRVIPDPHQPGMIYITTFGGSVWHGPTEGDPQAIEDTVIPLEPVTR
jgi:photosystem II stability/assembly factor-like uncharacterized protein